MINVLPVNDLKEHTEDSICDCLPVVLMEDEIVVVHNSYDGRELSELHLEIGLSTGISSRHGKMLKEGDVIETVQGSQFLILRLSDQNLSKMMDENGKLWDLEEYMSPNIFIIGNIFDDFGFRNQFLPLWKEWVDNNIHVL